MEDMSVTTSKRLINNTIINIATNVTNGLIVFFMIPFLVTRLGKESYGVWAIISSAFAYAPLLQLGLASSINRWIPVYMANGDDDGVDKVISTMTAFFLILGVLVLGLTWIMFHCVTIWFTSIPPYLYTTSKMLVLVVGIFWGPALFFYSFGPVLSGLQRYGLSSMGRFFPALIRALLLVIFISQGYGLITVALLYGVCELGTRFLLFVFSVNSLKRIPLSITSVDYKLFREMIPYGVNSFLYAMGAIIIYKSSAILLGIYLGVADVAKFSILSDVLILLSRFLQTFTAPTKPAVTDLDARSDRAKIREIAFLSQKYSLVLLFPSVAFLIIMGREFLEIWLGKDYGPLSAVLVILVIGHFLWLSQHSCFKVLSGIGEHRFFGFVTLSMAISTIFMTYIGINLFNVELFGAAVCTALPMGLISAFILPFYFNNKMNISIKDNLLNVWLPSLIGCLPSIALLFLWKFIFPPQNWNQIILVILFSGLFCLIGTWFFSMKSIERKRILRAIHLVPKEFNSAFKGVP